MRINDLREKSEQYPIKNLVGDIWHYAGDHRKHLVWGTIFRMCADIAGLFPAFAFATIVSYVTKGDFNVKYLSIIIVLWLLSATIKYIGKYVGARLIFYTAYEVNFGLEQHMLRVLMAKDSGWHEKETSGVKWKRIEKGAEGYNNVMRSWTSNYISIIIRFIGIPIILLKFNPTVAILVFIFCALYFLITKYFQKICIQTAHVCNVEGEELHGVQMETVSNIRTIRFLHIGSAMVKKVGFRMQSLLHALENRITAFNSRPAIMNWFSEFCRIGIIAFIIIHVIKGNYDAGLIVLFSVYFSDITTNIAELADVSQDTIVSRQSISRMYDLIGTEVPTETATQKFPKHWDSLRVENLSFNYGDNVALDDISFEIKNGQKIGIVGLSGAGKSTLFKLLVRERADHTGKITIGNIPIDEIMADEFYKHVSIVPQDTEVFNFSLKDNITIASPNKADDKKLLDKSITVSHVKDFIHKLKDGVDTLIGEKGVKLSGGERQRLGIARAIFKEPEILLLDEATSHLDLESEEKIKDSLHKFFENVTAIVIAHRLTTIREMDKIVVIEDGKKVEEGSFDELMKEKGRFHELWQKQQL